MFKKLVCFFAGHKKGEQIQTKAGYRVFICKRCKVLFAVKEETEWHDL